MFNRFAVYRSIGHQPIIEQLRTMQAAKHNGVVNSRPHSQTRIATAEFVQVARAFFGRRREVQQSEIDHEKNIRLQRV